MRLHDRRGAWVAVSAATQCDGCSVDVAEHPGSEPRKDQGAEIRIVVCPWTAGDSPSSSSSVEPSPRTRLDQDGGRTSLPEDVGLDEALVNLGIFAPAEVRVLAEPSGVRYRTS